MDRKRGRDDLRTPGRDMNRCLQIIITRLGQGRDNRVQNVVDSRPARWPAGRPGSTVNSC